jgi:hypothetical protein
MYAGEYSPFCRSCVMCSRFAAVGSTRYTTGTSGIACRWPLMFLTWTRQRSLPESQHPTATDASLSVADTYRCIVMPHPRRSLTRRTLLITSLPRLSNTSTFHMGSPSELSMGVDCGIKPFADEGSCWRSLDSCVALLRLRMRSIDAIIVSIRLSAGLECSRHTYLSVSQGLICGGHYGLRLAQTASLMVCACAESEM